jgi:hypothetical protein
MEVLLMSYGDNELESERRGFAQQESDKWKIIDKHLNSDGKDGNLLHRNTVLSGDDVEIHAIGYMVADMLDRCIRGKPPNRHFSKKYLFDRERLLISSQNGRGRSDIVKITAPQVPEEEKHRKSFVDMLLGSKKARE